MLTAPSLKDPTGGSARPRLPGARLALDAETIVIVVESIRTLRAAIVYNHDGPVGKAGRYDGSGTTAPVRALQGNDHGHGKRPHRNAFRWEGTRVRESAEAT